MATQAAKADSLVIDLRPDKKIVADAERMAGLVAAANKPVTTIAAHGAACEMIVEAKRRLKLVVAWYDRMLKPLNAARAEINQLKRQHTTPFETFIELRSSAVATFERAEEARRREQAERDRIEAQRKAKEEQERQAAMLRAAAKAAPKDVRSDLLAQAKAVESAEVDASGFMPERKERELDRAGMTARESWSAEVIDLGALVAGVASGEVPIGAIEPNQTWLNQQARQVREERVWHGVRFVNTPTYAQGRSDV